MKTGRGMAGLLLAMIAGLALAQGPAVNFGSLDQDKDGYLTPQEFTSYCGGYGRGMMGQAGSKGQNQQGVGMMNGPYGNGQGWGMQMMDSDNDGKISEAEFNTHRMAQHQGRFSQLDVNQDGVLSAQELAPMPRHQIDGSTAAWIKLYDKNGNGTLNSEEFATAQPGD